ncbi:hypothetical protein SDC9_38018 [bioreactor metagenome]|uniref:Uncharacterized protein n=1 Tax=bioreactor metagenome TaxID=1076179 RepID=A0A644VKS6_9ZZZZ
MPVAGRAVAAMPPECSGEHVGIENEVTYVAGRSGSLGGPVGRATGR